MAAAGITTLLLDIGGVLLTNGWDRHARVRACAHFDLDCEEMTQRHDLTFGTYEEGKLTLDQYLARVVFYRERPFGFEEFREFMFDQSQPVPEMIELVRTLKDRYHLKTGAVSNEGRELTVYRISEFDLPSFIDFFLCSCFVHFRKPDEDIFRMALDLVQQDPSQVAYIDDRSMFAEVARSLRINAIHHTSFASTRQSLSALGLNV